MGGAQGTPERRLGIERREQQCGAAPHAPPPSISSLAPLAAHAPSLTCTSLLFSKWIPTLSSFLFSDAKCSKCPSMAVPRMNATIIFLHSFKLSPSKKFSTSQPGSRISSNALAACMCSSGASYKYVMASGSSVFIKKLLLKPVWPTSCATALSSAANLERRERRVSKGRKGPRAGREGQREERESGMRGKATPLCARPFALAHLRSPLSRLAAPSVWPSSRRVRGTHLVLLLSANLVWFTWPWFSMRHHSV